jgi:hypothetical protein
VRSNKLQYLFLFAFLFVSSACAPVQDRRSSDSQALEAGDEFQPLEFKSLPLMAQLFPLQNASRLSTENSFKLKFWSRRNGDAKGPYLEPGSTVDVRLWMRMASGDHGSLPVSVSSSVDSRGEVIEGVYDITKVRFTMKGKWEIQIRLKTNDRIVDEVVQYVQVI